MQTLKKLFEESKKKEIISMYSYRPLNYYGGVLKKTFLIIRNTITTVLDTYVYIQSKLWKFSRDRWTENNEKKFGGLFGGILNSYKVILHP